jgi:hypothetical protein
MYLYVSVEITHYSSNMTCILYTSMWFSITFFYVRQMSNTFLSLNNNIVIIALLRCDLYYIT